MFEASKGCVTMVKHIPNFDFLGPSFQPAPEESVPDKSPSKSSYQSKKREQSERKEQFDQNHEDQAGDEDGEGSYSLDRSDKKVLCQQRKRKQPYGKIKKSVLPLNYVVPCRDYQSE